MFLSLLRHIPNLTHNILTKPRLYFLTIAVNKRPALRLHWDWARLEIIPFWMYGGHEIKGLDLDTLT